MARAGLSERRFGRAAAVIGESVGNLLYLVETIELCGFAGDSCAQVMRCPQKRPWFGDVHTNFCPAHGKSTAFPRLNEDFRDP